MRPSPHQTHLTRRLTSASVAALVISIAGLIFVASASATYEQVTTFANGPENQQMRQSTGIAVNTTGAGGVPAGTVYAISRLGARLVRYSPTGELQAEWGWGLVEGKNEYQRCGPDGDAAYPECGTVEKTGFPGEGRGQFSEPWGVAVDQSTGNVYVLDAKRQKESIQVFSADGSQVMAGFGEQAKHTSFPEPAESIEEGPGRFHRLSVNRQGIAVDDTGRVYVSDIDFPESNPPHHRRIMTFDPASPGDYEHYVYRGRSSDINIVDEPQQLAMDSANNLYVAGSAGIYEFPRNNPASPICKFPEPASGIVSMTVNPKTGEVFYFSYKNEEIHQLSACNGEEKFVETGTFATSPDTPQIYALASNPSLSYSGTRPPGVLYAGIYEIFEQISGKGFSHGRGYIFAQPEENPPAVESESVSAVGSTTATAEAKINPKGNPTRYSFQYITDAAYEENEVGNRFAGASEAPSGGAPLGTGQKVLSAAVALRELQPDTVYHYRAVAISHCSPLDEEKACEGVGADQTFRTFPTESSGLPDGRAYELVSPIQKDGGEAFPLFPDRASCGDECKPGKLGDRFPMASSPDGEAVVYEGFPFSYTEGAAIFNEYLSKRTSSGWQTTILSPLLQSNGENQGYRAFDDQLTKGVLYQRSPSLSPEASSEVANLYTQSTSDVSNLSPLLHSEPPNRTSDLGLGYAGSSADLSHVFFEANDALTEETAFAPPSIDWGVNGANLYESVNGELRLVNVLPGNTETMSGATFGAGRFDANSAVDVSHAVSSDGSRVFWSAKSGQVYLREDGEVTHKIEDPGKFLTASTNGSKLLLSNGHLIDLNEGTEEMVDLTQGKGNFLGILGQSEDLSTVYFVDPMALAPGAEDLKCQGSHGETKEEQEGKIPPGEGCNLYAWHDGETTFVTKLRSADNSPGGGDWQASPVERTAEASPEGRWVAFISSARQPGVNNLGPCIRQNGKDNLGACDEVFLYDSSTGVLTCASCNQSGAAPLGNSFLPQIVRSPGSLQQPRYLTDSGRLYFDSHDSLTPFDTNDGVEDVYQYEPGGIGTCKRAGGCINLISAGHEPIDSNFLSTDLTGKSIFFTSRDQLVLKDHDDLIDVYDAREGGGFPAETEASRSECQGEACQPVAVGPNDPTPASSSFEGAGNVDEKKAAKTHKKAHKKKHAKKKHAHKRAAKNNRGGAK
jgi:hypothetical protein